MKYLRVTMEDGSKYDVPVSVIAENRAGEYASEFNGDVNKSLLEDTLPLFDSDDYEIEDWAANNMNWCEVENVAIKVCNGNVNYQEGWINGDKEIITKPAPKEQVETLDTSDNNERDVIALDKVKEVLEEYQGLNTLILIHIMRDLEKIAQQTPVS